MCVRVAAPAKAPAAATKKAKRARKSDAAADGEVSPVGAKPARTKKEGVMWKTVAALVIAHCP